MAEAKESESSSSSLYQGKVTAGKWQEEGHNLSFKAHTDWMELRKDDKPIAKVFHVAYLQEDVSALKRPVTFVFNGGPGAASAYLHVGALGPQRVAFSPEGAVLPPPVQLVPNAESWLPFTDLVFVDPVGTGFSRAIPEKQEGKEEKEEPADPKEFWEVKRDLEALGEFVQRFLSKHNRWRSPVFLAGESYGGFRVAKLVRLLQEGYGVGLNGAILISPAIELSTLVGTDYDVIHWCDSFPTMAASAYFYSQASEPYQSMAFAEFRTVAEKFAEEELPLLLLRGNQLSSEHRHTLFQTMSSLLGVPRSTLEKQRGRLRIDQFRRELLKNQGLVCGLHDTTMSGVDPYPNRENFEGPDPALLAAERVFTSGINAQLREVLGTNPELDYHLLNMSANLAWEDKTRQHFIQQTVGSMDDLRYGMALNPHMKVCIVHGYQDLVTPYFSSARLARHTRLPSSLQDNLSLINYKGGHMFYSWESSRKEFRDDVAKLFQVALPST